MGGLVSGILGKKNAEALPAPTITDVKTPMVNQEQVDRETADIARRRRGSAATVLTGGDSSTAGSVAGKTLLG